MQQIILGSIFLLICSVFHVFVLGLCVPLLVKVGHRVSALNFPVKMVALVLTALAAIVGSHTVQVWLWALYWVQSGAMQDWNTAVYFSTVTYTTLGYGDVVLNEDLRIFGSFASVTGLLAFGISTAFLVGLIARLLPDTLDT